MARRAWNTWSSRAWRILLDHRIAGMFTGLLLVLLGLLLALPIPFTNYLFGGLLLLFALALLERDGALMIVAWIAGGDRDRGLRHPQRQPGRGGDGWIARVLIAAVAPVSHAGRSPPPQTAVARSAWARCFVREASRPRGAPTP